METQILFCLMRNNRLEPLEKLLNSLGHILSL